MKIAIFTDTYLPDLNGVATSSYTLRNVLKRHGHEVYVITSELPEDSDYVDHDDIIRLPGIEIKSLYGYRLSNLFSFKGMKEISKLGIELIHIQTEFGIGIFGKLAGLLLNVPVVYTYHTMYEDYTHYVAGTNETVNSAMKIVAAKLSKVYGDNCTELVVPSLKTKGVLEEYGINKEIHVIPTGLDLELFHPKNKNIDEILKIKEKYHLDNKYVVGFVGRIAPEKSVDVLIKAMQYVQNDNIHLLIVGGGPYLEDLKELVNDLELNHRITFTGGIDKSLIPNYYHTIDAFACASISETQGLTYIEALSSGTIVLARYDENLASVIKDGENGFFFKDEQDLANRLDYLIDYDTTKMCEFALSESYQYSDENFYDSIIDVYIQAIEHKHFTYRVKAIHESRNRIYDVELVADDHEFELKLSESVVDKFQLYKGRILEQDEFIALNDYEKVRVAYELALKYLTTKDYTEKQMRQRLEDAEDFDDLQIDMAMNALKEKNLINDYEYAVDYYTRAKRLSLGKNKALFNLRDKGISEEIIESTKHLYSSEDEYETALAIVSKSFDANHSKTRMSFIHSISDKLYMKGFSKDVITNVLANFDFSSKEGLEEELILKEFDKAFDRYSNKYEGKELAQKIYLYLLRKGFDYSLIKEVMKESGGDNLD